MRNLLLRQFCAEIRNWMRRFTPLLLALGMYCGTAPAAEMPTIVAQYAEAFVQAHPDEKTQAGRTVAEEYGWWFFRGFTSLFGRSAWAEEPFIEAYRLGQLYWRDHPSERADIFAGYGYLPVEKTGKWWRGFEVTAFSPEDDPNPNWWMTTIQSFDWRSVGVMPDKPKLGRGVRAHIRINGYVSPVGHYGHLGGFKREVLVMSGAPVADQ
jgi:hypothetical protein